MNDNIMTAMGYKVIVKSKSGNVQEKIIQGLSLDQIVKKIAATNLEVISIEPQEEINLDDVFGEANIEGLTNKNTSHIIEPDQTHNVKSSINSSDICVENNRFDNARTISLNRYVKMSPLMDSFINEKGKEYQKKIKGIYLHLRGIQENNMPLRCVQLYLSYLGEDWKFFRNGDVSILADEKIYRYSADEVLSEVLTDNSTSAKIMDLGKSIGLIKSNTMTRIADWGSDLVTGKVREDVIYQIPTFELFQIANSKSIEIQFRHDATKTEVKFSPDLKNIFMDFINGVFESDLTNKISDEYNKCVAVNEDQATGDNLVNNENCSASSTINCESESSMKGFIISLGVILALLLIASFFR